MGDFTIVADIGTCCTRIGYAGSDLPQVWSSSALGVTTANGGGGSNTSVVKGQEELHFDLSRFREDMSVSHPMREGLIYNWDAYQAIWEGAIKNSIKVDMRETPVLVTEKPYVPAADRVKLTELMFETVQVPALFISKDAVLDCYACGRSTGLVVDIGGSGTVITPVSDGWVESKGVIRSIVGGRVMDAKMLQLLGSKAAVPQSALTPLFRLQKQTPITNVHPTYDALARLELARGFKEAVCRAADSSVSENEAKFSAMPTLAYELPDGTVVESGLERFLVPEMVFDPSLIAAGGGGGDVSAFPDLVSLGLHHTREDAPPCNSETGLPRLICDSTLRCDGEIQHSMTANIVVAGGGSSFEGLPERIKAEVEKIVHASAPTWKIKTVSPSVGERALCTWLGGSILASLGSFNEIIMTKAEYAESGGSLVERKCP